MLLVGQAVQQETWRSEFDLPGGARRTRVWVTIEIRQCLVGWLLVQRYGPATKRIWFWRRRTVMQRSELASRWAELFVEDLARGGAEFRKAVPV